MEDPDLYRVLGVSRSSDAKEIKSAYRKIARDNHPDRNPGDEKAEETFKQASFAFEVLSDDKKRKLYDEFGVDGLRDGFDADSARRYGASGFHSSGGANFDDIFGSIFGGRSPFDTSEYTNFGGFYTGPMKGQDLQATITLDFLQAVEGGEFELNIDGRTVKTRIPPGANQGENLRIKGKGGAAPAQAPGGAKKGDLILTIQVRPHQLLRRDGLDLYLDVPITVGEALLGTKVEVPTPSGTYTVTVPTGVHSGAKLRLTGKGVQRGKKKGNFIVVLQIHTPDLIDDMVETLAHEIDAKYTENVRRDLKL